MMPATLARHQWTSADYERMLAAGMFEKIELLCGDVVITGARVRPFRWTLDDYEQPEPDIAIVVIDTPTNEAGRPTSASLIIEVAESSLAYDRDRKGPLYAAAGIQEYWLVNLPERCLEVYRQCMPDAASFSGWRYQERQRLRDSDQVAPLVATAVVIAVDALLPPG
jgi:Uma2 family endonuclease